MAEPAGTSGDFSSCCVAGLAILAALNLGVKPGFGAGGVGAGSSVFAGVGSSVAGLAILAALNLGVKPGLGVGGAAGVSSALFSADGSTAGFATFAALHFHAFNI